MNKNRVLAYAIALYFSLMCSGFMGALAYPYDLVNIINENTVTTRLESFIIWFFLDMFIMISFFEVCEYITGEKIISK